MRRSASISSRAILIPAALVCCWSLWVVASGVGWALKAPEKLPYILRYNGVDGTIGLVVCGLLFLAYDRLGRRVGLGTVLALMAPLCYAAALVWHTASVWTLWRLGWNDRLYLDTRMLLVGGGLMDGITLALFSLLFFAVDHWFQLGEQREKAREATALAHQAQLQMLRYQLNPHFLFNALNSIRAMILREPERARQIVTELAEFLRYSLNGRGPVSTVGEEMQAIGNYLAIQRIRFEEKLAVTVRVDPEVHAFVLPGFLVHPLVENAVKYGMQTSETPLRIAIEITAEAGGLRIRVSNTGRLVPEAPEAGGARRDGHGAEERDAAPGAGLPGQAPVRPDRERRLGARGRGAPAGAGGGRAMTACRAVIVDDERLARRELAFLLQSHPEVQLVGEAGSVQEAARLLESLQPDLLFLDIQMPRESGFDLFERTRVAAQVIFVTAHDEFAVRAFEVNALDYLMKPVNPERLQAGDRAVTWSAARGPRPRRVRWRTRTRSSSPSGRRRDS